MSPSRIIRRSLIAFSAALFVLLGTLAAAGTSQASLPPSAPSSMVSLTASMAPPVPSGTTRLGALAPETKLSIEVALNIPDQGALTAFLTELSDPGSPDFQHFLRPGQFGPMFGPSLAQVAAVENALKSAGLSPGQVSANRLAIPVTASAVAIERAFGITLASYRLRGGREAYANTAAPQLPATVAPLVQGVLGLDDIYQVQHLSSGPLPTAPMVLESFGEGRRTSPPGDRPRTAAVLRGGRHGEHRRHDRSALRAVAALPHPRLRQGCQGRRSRARAEPGVRHQCLRVVLRRPPQVELHPY